MAGKAVAFMKIDVLVEVDKLGEFYAMLEQAEVKLAKHVVAGAGFFPFRHTTDMIEEDTTVAELLKKLTIQPGTGWNDR
jgi:hypothetical protein